MNDDVRKYFETDAREFDNIYENEGNNLINKIFRKSLYERVPIAIKECGKLRNKTVLDIGCGSGRVSFLPAKEGAKVIGIDFSSNMIDLAKRNQERLGKGLDVDFKTCDFMRDFKEGEKYDISLALGVFDYIKDPVPFLCKIKNVTKERFIVSYPAKFAFQAPIRKVWLYTRNCPVFFYTENRIKKIYAELGLEQIRIIKTPLGAKIPTGYVVTAKIC